MAWTLDAVRMSEGVRRSIVANETPALPATWRSMGQSIRILETTPTTAHDTVGILYWRHRETPLSVKTEGADCETVSRPGSVMTTRQCDAQVFVVTAHCGKGCRRNIVRAVADSLGANAVIVSDEQLSFRGRPGEPLQVPQSTAEREGFQGTYVMIKTST